jgi:uncharacterized membrane protein YphA (DoxX/SURF4 family)
MRLTDLLATDPLRDGSTVFLRAGLSTAFLSAVADRFGLWGQFGTPNVAWGDFGRFAAYTDKLNPLVPDALIPLVAWGSTALELVLGVTLLLGVFTRLSALASGGLLLVFALAMAAVLGLEQPLSLSVFTASAGGFLLAAQPRGAYLWSLDRWLGLEGGRTTAPGRSADRALSADPTRS